MALALVSEYQLESASGYQLGSELALEYQSGLAYQSAWALEQVSRSVLTLESEYRLGWVSELVYQLESVLALDSEYRLEWV